MSTDTSARSTGARTDVGERTLVGVDVGELPLAAVAPAGSTPAVATTVAGGSEVRGIVRHMERGCQLLASVDDTEASAEVSLVAAAWSRLRPTIVAAARDVVDEVAEHTQPVLVRERLTAERTPLWEHRRNPEIGTWLLPVLTAWIDRLAVERGVPVVAVDPHGTSRRCHECDERGELEGETFRCRSPTCRVGAVDRDVNAALVIADEGRRRLSGASRPTTIDAEGADG